MANENPKHNAVCKSDEHTKHLCYFVSYGYHVNNPDDYKDLIEEPKYICHICGRVAHNAESLCSPKSL